MTCHSLLLGFAKEGNNHNGHEAVLRLSCHVQSDDDDDGTERGVGSEAEQSRSGDSNSAASDTESDGDSEATVDETRAGEGAVQETEGASASVDGADSSHEAHQSAIAAAAVEAGMPHFHSSDFSSQPIS